MHDFRPQEILEMSALRTHKYIYKHSTIGAKHCIRARRVSNLAIKGQRHSAAQTFHQTLIAHLPAVLPNILKIEITSAKFEILFMTWARCAVSDTSICTSISAV